MSSNNPNPDRRPAPTHLPATLTETNPFYIDMSQGTHRKALPPFTSTLTRRNTLPRTSAEILAELQVERDNRPAEHVASRHQHQPPPAPHEHPRHLHHVAAAAAAAAAPPKTSKLQKVITSHPARAPSYPQPPQSPPQPPHTAASTWTATST